MSDWLVCFCACARVSDPLGGLSKIGSDPMKVVGDVMEESTNMISVVLKFAASLIAPEEDEGKSQKTWSKNKQCIP